MSVNLTIEEYNKLYNKSLLVDELVEKCVKIDELVEKCEKLEKIVSIRKALKPPEVKCFEYKDLLAKNLKWEEKYYNLKQKNMELVEELELINDLMGDKPKPTEKERLSSIVCEKELMSNLDEETELFNAITLSLSLHKR
jgi:hypothetical protein